MLRVCQRVLSNRLHSQLQRQIRRSLQYHISEICRLFQHLFSGEPNGCDRQSERLMVADVDLLTQPFLNPFQEIRNSMKGYEDFEYAMLAYLRTFEDFQTCDLKPQKLCDGWVFATMLRGAQYFKLSYADLSESSEKWTFRLSNLKKILMFIEEYFDQQTTKAIKTQDIDLVEIAKNSNLEEVLKFFELVIAVLTEAPNKEEHINRIMSLDQTSQTAFVQIIQSILQNRITERSKENEDKWMGRIGQLDSENYLLRQEVERLENRNEEQEKELEELRAKCRAAEEEIDSIADQKLTAARPVEEPEETEHLRNLIENLKHRLITTAKEHEEKESVYRQKILELEEKLQKYCQQEEQLAVYKQKYNDAIEAQKEAKFSDKERQRWVRRVEEKQSRATELESKVNRLLQANSQMQEKQVFLRMQLEKLGVREKELNQLIRQGSCFDNLTTMHQQPRTPTLKKHLSQDLESVDQEGLEELEAQLEDSEKKLRESQRENTRLKHALERMDSVENDKRTLEKLILDLNAQKAQQVQLLLQTAHDFYVENRELKKDIKSGG